MKKTKPESTSSVRYDSKAFHVELGKRIRKLRKESGLTIRDLIVDHGFHTTQLTRIEKGEGISVPMLLRVAQAFQVPIETLVAGLGRIEESVESRSKTSKD